MSSTVSVSTKTITSADGKTKKITIREERKVVDGKEQIIRTEQEEYLTGSQAEKACLGANVGTPSLTSSSAGAKPQAPQQTLEQFRQDCLQKQNDYRAKHKVPALKLSDTLNRHAQEWADHMAKTGSFQHRQNSVYGENLFFAMNSRGDVSGSEAVDNWYSEIKNYKFGDAVFSGGTGHFTQVVWKASTEFGCGRAQAAGGKVYVVGNYSPPGNVQGQYRENVLPPK